MTNRKIAALETRKKLLEAGKKIICKKGLDNTAVEEITEAATYPYVVVKMEYIDKQVIFE